MRILSLLVATSVATAVPMVATAQSDQGTGSLASVPTAPTATVPRLVVLTGTLRPADGNALGHTETVTLLLYADESGGAPLWEETQVIELDAAGRYSVLLGATRPDGVPMEAMASGQARWLAMRWESRGEGESRRTRLTFVPYALRAADAETLGGRPPSAYALARPNDSSTPGPGATGADPAPNPATVLVGAANYVPKYVNSVDVSPSAMYENGGLVGINTTLPQDVLHAKFTNSTGSMTGIAVQNLGSTAASYSGMLFYDQNGALGQFQGFNNSTHEYRINNIASGGTISFMIGGDSKFKVANNGDVQFGTNGPTLHVVGTGSFGLGQGSLSGSILASYNTAVGHHTIAGVGGGDFNAAFGESAMASNQNGSSNAAFGQNALVNNSAGSYNTAVGSEAAFYNTIGARNIAIGYRAGMFVNGDNSNNIEIGNVGQNADNGVIRIGDVFQTKFFAAGIRGVTTAASNDAALVFIDSNGQLGTVSTNSNVQLGGIDGPTLHVANGSSFGLGYSSLSNSTGDYNTAVGDTALQSATSGSFNTAIGWGAAGANQTGSNNIAIGYQAGLFVASNNSNNIEIGHTGTSGDSGAIRLGTAGTHTSLFAAGIRGVTTGANNAVPVVIDSNGQLGTVSSSRRFKEDIQDMGEASSGLLRLRPVTFRYKKPFEDGSKPTQYGLIAEEVAEVYPDLVAKSADGQIETVKYQLLDPLLLNELQKQSRLLEQQRAEIDELKARLTAVERRDKK